MAVRTHQGTWLTKGVHKATWTGLLNTDNGDNFDGSILSDKTVHVKGTFGTGGTLVIEGSNNGGTTFATLNDPQGNPLSFTVEKIETILEKTELLRPRVTAGDGTTNLSVYLVSRADLR